MINGRFHLQGHRGARGLCPENTLPSFELALDHLVTSIETDLFLTRDGVPVLCHDPFVSEAIFRPTDGAAAFVQPLICQLTLSELRRFVADGNPNPRRFPDQVAIVTPAAGRFAERHGFHPFAVPALPDLFGFVREYAGELGDEVGKSDLQREGAARLVFDLELKRTPFRPEQCGWGADHTVTAVLEAVCQAGLDDRTVIRSFDHRCVALVRERGGGTRTAVLVAGTVPADPGGMLRAAGATVFAPDMEFVDRELVERCHREGGSVIPWTVNQPLDWQRMLEIGVDGMTTDYPDRLARWLRQRGIPWR